MNNKGSLMPQGTTLGKASSCQIRLRRVGTPALLQFSILALRLPPQVDIPENAKLVVIAYRQGLQAMERIILRMSVKDGSIQADWCNLSEMPADEDAESKMEFEVRVVPPSGRLALLVEEVTVESGSSSGATRPLLMPRVVDASEMQGLPFDIDPDWHGTIPARIRVSSDLAGGNVSERIRRNDPALMRTLAAGTLHSILTRIFLSNDDVEETKDAWMKRIRMLCPKEDNEILDRICTGGDDKDDMRQAFSDLDDISRKLAKAFAATLSGILSSVHEGT